ncbi:hypothetical protein C8R44DRAFT_790314 [Mycena epipterygia]|nr:hypothetical protein C8R44DRAFT_790314 [Mycena epipterygia]
MQRFFIVLLFLGLVRATLQNYTVDDTSSDIVYNQTTFQCNTTTCPDGSAEGLFNKSATLTLGSITFSFTGTAFYAFLDLVGACSFNVDGNQRPDLNITPSDAEQETLIVSKSDMANGPHTLVIAPIMNGTIIGFDHLIYTADLPDKKSHVGAIVGGVIGGVVLTIGALFAALFARRRKLVLRRNQRKSAILRGITSARPDYKAGAYDGTDLPS